MYINCNLSHPRFMINGFHKSGIKKSNEPYVSTLVDKKHQDNTNTSPIRKSFYLLSDVPGAHISNIVKMVQPTTKMAINKNNSSCTDSRLNIHKSHHMSSYMMYIAGSEARVKYAARILKDEVTSSQIRALGIDIPEEYQSDNLEQQREIIAQFYPTELQFLPKRLVLNQTDWIELDPTSPYFEGQKLLTHDFTIFRKDDDSYKIAMLKTGSLDDSCIMYNRQPVIELLKRNNALSLQEESWKIINKTNNQPRYFIEMMQYIRDFSKNGDFMAQNSFERSSDRNTAHLQFIPGEVILPIFHRAEGSKGENLNLLEWYLTTFTMNLDMYSPATEVLLGQLQQNCIVVEKEMNISTTPVLRRLDETFAKLYLIFKQYPSFPADIPATEETIRLAPGWLESCGVFLDGTDMAKNFMPLDVASNEVQKHAQAYYHKYKVNDLEKLQALLEKGSIKSKLCGLRSEV